MPITDEQIAFVTDLFSDLGPTTTRKMFGGLAIYADGTIFAILMGDGTLNLKGGSDMPMAFETAGWHPWT